MIYEYRNPIYSSANTIDCEINHPQHGWIPHTCSITYNSELYNDIITNNTLSDYVPPPAPPLSNIQSRAKTSIDHKAEQIRLKYITNGAGQAMAYQEKADEATDYVVAGYPVDLSSYPFIQAEVNATGKTATEAADDILATKSAWIAISASIEEARIGAKVQIDAATTAEEIDTILSTTISTLDAI